MSAGSTELHKGLNQRHLTMIAIGGVIGAGLFVGSGVVIKDAGPAAFLTYAITGVLIIMVMRMLGEMAMANPSTGSFADYARRALGGWAGFSVGWLYWYFWVIVVGFEAVAGAKILTYWFDAPLWLLSLVLMILMTATNLFSVSSFGEFEFWFAGIKVVAIVAFIVLGSLYVLGHLAGQDAGLLQPDQRRRLLPERRRRGLLQHRRRDLLDGRRGDRHHRRRRVRGPGAGHRQGDQLGRRPDRDLLRRLDVPAGRHPAVELHEEGASPYVSAFTEMGIPYADHIMNAVVLTAVLSCLNSGLYTASRMLFVLAARREAPVWLITVNSRGVPTRAILASTVVGFLCVIAAAVSPDTVFLFLLNSSGAIILFVYLLIAVSQLILRRRTSPEKLKVKMWLFPVLTMLTIAGILGVLVVMGVDGGHPVPAAAEPARLGGRAGAVLRDQVGGSVGAEDMTRRQPSGRPRVLVLANETVAAPSCCDELRPIDAEGNAEYFVCVPANPVDTGQAEHKGAVWVWEATVQAAQDRLDATLAAWPRGAARRRGARRLPAADRARRGGCRFKPDRIVISTHPRSTRPGCGRTW